MPDSKNDAERDMLKVAMQLIRIPDIHHAVGVDVGGVHLEDTKNAFPVLAQRSKPHRGLAVRYLAITGLTRLLLMVCEPGGSNFRSLGFS